ncbi:MAG: ABC transporter ATP-binding protein [Xanthobacteraceae bacterium]|nr:ABC transporter ATP-binding protein [Xanthobacteraceae bacterium]
MSDRTQSARSRENSDDAGRVAGAGRTATAIGSSISIEQVTRRYGGFLAIDNASLAIAPGEFITLLGPSGSGKTTLLNLIAGFQKVDSGRILVDGAPIQNIPPYRRGFGMVFQSYALFPNMTVTQNVAFPLRMAGIGRAETERRVAETLEMMRLSAHAQKMPSQMSGGQQQRVAIARAIVMRPKVVLMDEPLSALDRRLREEIQIEIRDLHQTIGSTILFVTHDQGEALTLSDRIAVLNAGEIVQIGSPIDIYQHPSNPFVASFIGESNLIAADVVSRAGSSLTLKSRAGVVFHAESNRQTEAGQVSVLVRPERVRIAPQPAAATLPAVVTSSLFLGELLRIEAHLQSGERILIRCTNNAVTAMPAVGETLHVGWDPKDCWVLS